MARSKVLMVLLSALAMGGGKPASSPSDEFVVDEYRFEWTLAKEGKVTLQLEKTAETVCIWLRANMNILSMTPAAAKAVGFALSKADTYYAAMRGEKEKRETVKAGAFRVTWWNSPTSGFSCSVRSGEPFRLDSVFLSRKEALALSVPMAKADLMAAFIVKKLAKAGL